VREQGAALGQLSLYRPMDAPAFTPRERADLASVMRYVAHGVATGLSQLPATDAFTFEDSDQEAMLVTDRSGVIRHGSETARRLLSPQQREIAILLAQGKSSQEMAAGLGISENTVAYHIKQLFMKLDVHDRAAALKRITGRAPGAASAAS